MDLTEALRTTGAVREFTDEPVDDATVGRLLETARFAPNGGNRQAWKVVVVRDPAVRRALRDAYLPGWYEYLAQVSAGLTPWAVVTDRARERDAVAHAGEVAAAAADGPGGFAEHLDEVPVLLVSLELAGVLSPKQLSSWRRWAIVGIVVLAGVITPSSDPFSMLAMAIPLYIFYELSIVIGKIVRR